LKNSKRFNPIKRILKGKVVFLGIGNSLRHDDGLGPEIIVKLKTRIDAPCIDAGEVPENYFGKIVKENPDTVLIIDAVYLYQKPGDFRVLNRDEILNVGISTHDVSPSVFIRYLAEETGAEIYMLGVQPQNIQLGEGISEIVAHTLHVLEDMIVRAWQNRTT
jgi:hydrogenase 3 maturation protease